jgi:hypothetical protein
MHEKQAEVAAKHITIDITNAQGACKDKAQG